MFQVNRVIAAVELPRSRPWQASAVSAPVRLALRQAFRIAEADRLPLTLLTVLPESSSPWRHSVDEQQQLSDRTTAVAVLQQLIVENAADDRPIPVEPLVRAGEPWEQLIRTAGNRPDTLIVCGTRELSPLRRLLFGSTGMKLLRLASGPVWINKPVAVDNDSTDIVAATDAGPVGQKVIRTAVSLCRHLNARLHVVHASGRSEPAGPQGVGSPDDQIREQLAAADARTLPFGARVIVEPADPDELILRTVREAHADLLVLGTTSKPGFAGLLPGSTVERLLPDLDCSVLALKPDEFRSLLPPDFWTAERSAQ